MEIKKIIKKSANRGFRSETRNRLCFYQIFLKNLFERRFVKFSALALVFTVLAIAMVMGGNVVVKDGELNVTDDFFVSRNSIAYKNNDNYLNK